MPDWVAHLITAVVSSAFVSAVAAACYKIMMARHRIGRESRGDEIGVLHRVIDECRKDCDKLRADLTAQQARHEERDREWDRRFGVMKDEHTASLIEQERLRGRERYLVERQKHLSDRLDPLEAEVRGLRPAPPGGPQG